MYTYYVFNKFICNLHLSNSSLSFRILLVTCTHHMINIVNRNDNFRVPIILCGGIKIFALSSIRFVPMRTLLQFCSPRPWANKGRPSRQIGIKYRRVPGLFASFIMGSRGIFPPSAAYIIFCSGTSVRGVFWIWIGRYYMLEIPRASPLCGRRRCNNIKLCNVVKNCQFHFIVGRNPSPKGDDIEVIVMSECVKRKIIFWGKTTFESVTKIANVAFF